MTARMKALTRTTYGGPEVLTFASADVPEPTEGSVLVRMHAASPNMADWHFLTGEPWLVRLQLGLRRPRHDLFGTDVAGVVEAIGPGVTRLAVGDRVFGNTGGRAFAECTTLPASDAARIPDGVSFAQAAALPIAGATALQAVSEIGQVSAGDRVLINGASGGVGHFAVQIAALLGAEVTGVSSARNHELVRSLGAIDTIDYAATDYTASGRTWDTIIDVQGNHTGGANRRALAADGHWVMVGGPKANRALGPLPWALAGLLRFSTASQHAHMFVTSETRERLETLAAWVATGEVEPSIERTFPLAAAGDAMRHLGAGHTRGKVVIEVTV